MDPPDPDPRPNPILEAPQGEALPDEKEEPKRRGPKKGDPRLTGRPADPWTCSKEWLLEEYNIRDH